MKKILIIDNYDSFVFNIVQLLREAPETPAFEIVRNDQINFSKLSGYDGIILSPGPGIPADAGDLMRLLQVCKYTHPILGICLGHQAIAEAFGASLYHLSYPLHGHRTRIKLLQEQDPLLAHLSLPIVVGRYHSWVVAPETMPSELVVSSVDEQGHIMSFYHHNLPIYCLQFHPESYISNCGKIIMQNWLEIVRKWTRLVN